MAGKEFPLSLIIKAVDKATAPLRKVSEQIEGIAGKATKAGTALSVGVTAPLAGLATASVLAFSTFESGMANVSTLIDTGTENLEAMGKQVLAISRRTPVALQDLTSALYDIRSAGVSATDQFLVLEGAAQLAVAGLGTTKEAVDLVTSSINAFNLQGEEQARIYDVIFKTVKSGKTNIAQLAQGFGAVAGTVASAGVKVDEYMASVAALTTTGLPAAQAHTQLRAVISGLTRETKDSKRLFDHLSAKSFKDLIAKSGGLVPALNLIKTALRGDDAQMLNLFGSTEALNAVLGLTGQQAGTFKSTLNDMRNGAEALGGAFEKQNKKAEATMQRLMNSLQSVAVSVGRILIPALDALIPLLEGAADWWESLSGETQKAIVAFAAAAAALGPVLVVVGNLATVFGTAHKAVMFAAGWGKYLWMMRASIMAGLVPSLTAAAGSVWAFTVALLANPITWIIIGIVALAAAVYLIYKHWEPIKAFFADVWVGAVDAMKYAWEGVADFFSGLWDGVVEIFTDAWKRIEPIVDAAKKVFEYSPLGLALKGASALGGMVFGADEAGPMVGAERAAPPAGVRSTEARVVVDFNNAPKGTRATPDATNTAPLDLSMGYSMVLPL